MDKLSIERIALEVAGSLSAPYVSDASLVRFAAEFLARIDAERGKEAAAIVDFSKQGWRAFIEAIRVLPDGTLLFLSPTIPEGWQPIETAPQTGRTILLGYVNELGNWRTLRGQWFSRQTIEDEWEDGEEGWYETSVEADDMPNCWMTNPTHWMPLPTPPAAQGERNVLGE